MSTTVVTDSSAQLPDCLLARHSIAVAPITVTIDGHAYREGIDLSADEFFARLAAGDIAVTTSQPSPGDFVDLYRSLAGRGATHIVSIHVGAAMSGTLNSAATAAALVDADITLIDTGAASFGVGACTWEAARCLEAGGSTQDVQALIAEISPRLGTSVLLDGLDYVRAGGRFTLEATPEGTAVYSGVGAALDVVGSGASVDELVELLARPFAEAPGPIRAAVALADPATEVYTKGLEARLEAMDHVVDIIRYRVGPSIAAHTGPGTAGGFHWPAIDIG